MCLGWRTRSDTNGQIPGYNFRTVCVTAPDGFGTLSSLVRLPNPSLSATNSPRPQRAALRRPAGHATLVCTKSPLVWSKSNMRGHAGLPKIQRSRSAAKIASRPT